MNAWRSNTYLIEVMKEGYHCDHHIICETRGFQIGCQSLKKVGTNKAVTVCE